MNDHVEAEPSTPPFHSQDVLIDDLCYPANLMTEKMPSPIEGGQETEQISETNAEIALFNELARRLSERRENFAFPGLNPEDYNTLKKSDEEYPGFVTPIDELIQRFQDSGFHVVLGDDPLSGNVFILPVGSEDVVRDSVFPRHLRDTEGMDPDLRQLIQLMRKRKK